MDSDPEVSRLALVDITCEDCGATVRSLPWMRPKQCMCGAMTVHKRIARYAKRDAPPTPFDEREPLMNWAPAVTGTFVDNDGENRIAEHVALPSGQNNEYSWTESMGEWR